MDLASLTCRALQPTPGVRRHAKLTASRQPEGVMRSNPCKDTSMPPHTHETAPTQFAEANGIRFAYRRFGKAAGVPIVFNQHYMGTMDYWDPTVTDGLARDREVILFDNAGVSSSSGEVPTTFEQMGANAVAFSRALGLKQVDVL